MPLGLRQLATPAIMLVTALPLAAHVALGVGLAPVLSASMEPAISAGSLEVWRPKPAASLEVGDIVILRDQSTYTQYSHRIVALERAGEAVVLTTKGDGNPALDSQSTSVPLTASVPVVQAAVPRIGGFFATATGRRGTLIAWVVLALSLTVYAASAALNTREKGS